MTNNEKREMLRELLQDYHKWLSEQTGGFSTIDAYLKQKEEKPKTWEEFCYKNTIKSCEACIAANSIIVNPQISRPRSSIFERNLLPNRETAEAMLALCQLIQLRECYNDGWQPEWNDRDEYKYFIAFFDGNITMVEWKLSQCSPLYFKSAELRSMFLNNFRDLIEKLKPLYGIKEGGEE